MPMMLVSVRVEWAQVTKTNTRALATAALVVVRVIVVLVTLSDLVPRLLSSAIAPGVAPVPLSAMVWGLPVASFVMEMLAERPPVAVGVKVTEIVQVAPAANVLGALGQVVVRAKSAAFVPVSAMPAIVSGAEPELVRVTLCAALVVPMI